MSNGQVALVTGATSVIGRSIAAELGARGAALLLMGRREHVLAEVAGELRERGVDVETATGDVTDPRDVEAAVARATDAFGPITIAVNNAGGTDGVAAVAESDRQVWLETLLLNTYGPYLVARAVLPSMLADNRGRIITLSSRAATWPIPGGGAYVAAKTAVTRLTEVIAVETLGRGVATFSVDPGRVLSEAAERVIERGDRSREMFSDPPEATAKLVATLASGHYDTLSGSFLDIRDDLDALVEQKDIRALRVVHVPADSLADPVTG